MNQHVENKFSVKYSLITVRKICVRGDNDLRYNSQQFYAKQKVARFGAKLLTVALVDALLQRYLTNSTREAFIIYHFRCFKTFTFLRLAYFEIKLSVNMSSDHRNIRP